jgi:hypothetical protein
MDPMIVLAVIGAGFLTAALWFLGINLSDNYIGYQNAIYKAEDSKWGNNWLTTSKNAFYWSLLWFVVVAGMWWWLVGSRFVHITIGWK